MEAVRLTVQTAPDAITMSRLEALVAGLCDRAYEAFRVPAVPADGGMRRGDRARGRAHRDKCQAKAVWGSIVH